jgi:hypothetical protein
MSESEQSYVAEWVNAQSPHTLIDTPLCALCKLCITHAGYPKQSIRLSSLCTNGKYKYNKYAHAIFRQIPSMYVSITIVHNIAMYAILDNTPRLGLQHDTQFRYIGPKHKLWRVTTTRRSTSRYAISAGMLHILATYLRMLGHVYVFGKK